MELAVVIVLVVIALGFAVYRLRAGGPGPAMNGMPRSLRSSANSCYDKRGWQKAFNDDGSRNRDRDAV